MPLPTAKYPGQLVTAAYDRPRNKIKEGDIVAVRPPSNGVGLKDPR